MAAVMEREIEGRILCSALVVLEWKSYGRNYVLLATTQMPFQVPEDQVPNHNDVTRTEYTYFFQLPVTWMYTNNDGEKCGVSMKSEKWSIRR